MKRKDKAKATGHAALLKGWKSNGQRYYVDASNFIITVPAAWVPEVGEVFNNPDTVFAWKERRA